MIAKGKAISHGGNAIAYAMREGKMDEIITSNVLESRTPENITKEMEMINSYSTRCRNRYMHFQIGIAPQDRQKLNKDNLRNIAKLFGQRMGLQDNQ